MQGSFIEIEHIQTLMQTWHTRSNNSNYESMRKYKTVDLLQLMNNSSSKLVVAIYFNYRILNAF